MSEKIKFLSKMLEAKRLDGMIVSDDTNIKYLIGTDIEGILIITPAENIFLTTKRYADYAASKISIEKGINILTVEKTTKKELEEIFWGLNRIGIEEKAISHREYLNYKEIFNIEPLETEGIIETLRETKDDEELEYIEKASEILTDVYTKSLANIRRGMSEKQIAHNIKKNLMQTELELEEEPVKIQSGENSAKPYFTPTNRKLQKGDVVTIMLNGKYKGYLSEISRTIFVGEPTEKQKEEYSKLLKIHDSLLRNIKNRAYISDITKTHTKMLEEINWDIKYYLAHGIGLEKEEFPEFVVNTNKVIKDRMTIVVEPSIYKQNYGMRIADTIQITEYNFKTYTKANRELTII